MLSELHIEGLGVIEKASIVMGGGLVAITGETGAGKTMIVEAIDLLLGERFDSTMLRTGCDEARIDGRFVHEGREIVLSRVMPREGRSRAYVDGRLATAAQLADIGAGLVDLHGQNAQHSIVRQGAQRAALDSFGKIDTSDVRDARARLTEIDANLAALGGDARTRARDIDLLRFQIEEIQSANISDPDEDRALETEEDLLASAQQYRESFAAAYGEVSNDDGALDRLHAAVAALGSNNVTAAMVARLKAIVAEVEEVAAELRHEAESIEENPSRLEELRHRRQLLRDLRRKYGDSLSEVLGFLETASRQYEELVGHDARVAELERERFGALEHLSSCQARVLKARSKAAPKLAAAVNEFLPGLALPNATVSVEVRGEGGDEVEFRFSANPGMPLMPLSKVASGGETSRLMLALNLVLTTSPETLVFDEVDAGIGGDAANTVAAALGRLGLARQVLVVTHLPQVAATAQQQIHVLKNVENGMTFAVPQILTEEQRVEEIARMLSGDASSKTARAHAKEIIAEARTRVEKII